MATSILLVDDEIAVVRALQRLLERSGYQVLVATHGEHALELLTQQPVAIVITDYRMPGLTGAELLQQIQQRHPHTIGLILSAFTDRQMLISCLNSGVAYKFIEKPWDDQLLLQDIRAALSERQRRIAEMQRTNLLLSSDEALLELAASGAILRLNHAAAAVLQQSSATLQGKTLADVFADINPIELATFFHKKDHDITLTSLLGHRILLSHRTSDIYHYLLKLSPAEQVPDHFLTPQDTVLPLTSLQLHLENMILTGQRFAVVSLDMADYQTFSDGLSTQALDALLHRILQRLQQQLPHGAVMGCASSHRFVVLLSKWQQETELHQLIDTLLQPFSQRLAVGQDQYPVHFAVGYAVFPDDARQGRELLNQAKTASRHHQLQRLNLYLRYDPHLTQMRRQQFEISHALYNAIEEQQFTLWYQPKIHLATGKVAAAEALLRWHHPKLGNVSPALFIPVAEQDGQIHAIGDWVMQQCALQLSRWHAQGILIEPLAINLSGRQLDDDDLPKKVQQLLERYQLDPAWIELELTETFLMQDLTRSALLLERLHRLGIKLAMDDFGTGYSSLAYLAKLPVDVLKLDRSLLLEIEDSPQAASLVRHIIRMAHELNMQVVAEGIESHGQLQLLEQMECDWVQGYVYSPAVMESQLVQLVQQQPWVPAAERALLGSGPRRDQQTYHQGYDGAG